MQMEPTGVHDGCKTGPSAATYTVKLPAELSWSTFKAGTAGYKVRVLQSHSDVWWFELIVL